MTRNRTPRQEASRKVLLLAIAETEAEDAYVEANKAAGEAMERGTHKTKIREYMAARQTAQNALATARTRRQKAVKHLQKLTREERKREQD